MRSALRLKLAVKSETIRTKAIFAIVYCICMALQKKFVLLE